MIDEASASFGIGLPLLVPNPILMRGHRANPAKRLLRDAT